MIVRPPEILDAGTASDLEVENSLRDLRRINRWLGGRRVLRTILDQQVTRTGLRQFSLLDVGTGSGDMRPEDGFTVGLDRQIRHLRLGSGLRVCGDALALPFADRSFDFVAANLLLHHFAGADAVALLQGMARVARHAVLINDLERHPLAYAFVRWGPFSAVTRHDGALSVERAFQKDELATLARKAGFVRFRVRRHLPFRLSLVAELS